jgi:hypothetical protein
VLVTLQELGLPVNLIDTNFLKDPSVLESAEFQAINPAGKCACDASLLAPLMKLLVCSWSI